MERGKNRARTWVCAGAFAVLVLALHLLVSYRRPFWTDEHLAFQSIQGSYFHLVVNGPFGQCSPSPLFYLVGKFWFWLASIDLTSPLAPVLVRLPAALAAMGFLVCLIRSKLSTTGVAVLAAFLLLRDENLTRHATEFRPYSLWLWLSLLFLLRLYQQATHPSRQGWWWLGGWAFLLAATSSGSLFLLFGAGVWMLLLRRDLFRPVAIALAPGAALALYYALLSSCYYSPSSAEQYNFWFAWNKGDMSLVRAVSKLLVAPREWLDLPVNLAFLWMGWLWWKRRLPRETKIMLSIIVIAFGLALALTAAAVIHRNYYFIPRMFVFMLAARGVLVVLALVLLAQQIQTRCPKARSFLPWAGGVYATLCLWEAVHTGYMALLFDYF